MQMHGINHKYDKIFKYSKKEGRKDVESLTNEGLTKDVITHNLDARMFEDADNFYDDDDHIDKSKNNDDNKGICI